MGGSTKRNHQVVLSRHVYRREVFCRRREMALERIAREDLARGLNQPVSRLGHTESSDRVAREDRGRVT